MAEILGNDRFKRIIIDVSDFDLKHNTRVIISNLVSDLRSKPYFDTLLLEGNFTAIEVDYDNLKQLCVKNYIIELVYSHEDKEVSVILDDKAISRISLIR